VGEGGNLHPILILNLGGCTLLNGLDVSGSTDLGVSQDYIGTLYVLYV